jgi:hypothetical protein
MPAVWTTPITWQVDQLVTNTDLNEQVRDNLEYLLSPNHQRIMRDNGGAYSITNVTTFQDIDSTNLSITITTHGGPVLVHFQGTINPGATTAGYLDLTVDGVRVGAAFTTGLTTIGGTGVDLRSMMILLTGLAAGTYTIRPQWRTDPSDTLTLNASAATNPTVLEVIEL